MNNSPVPRAINYALAEALEDAEYRGMRPKVLWLGWRKEREWSEWVFFNILLTGHIAGDARGDFHGIPIKYHDIPGIVVECERELKPQTFNGLPVFDPYI